MVMTKHYTTASLHSELDKNDAVIRVHVQGIVAKEDTCMFTSILQYDLQTYNTKTCYLHLGLQVTTLVCIWSLRK